MSDDGEKRRRIIGLVECVIFVRFHFRTNVAVRCLWWLRWMVWYVCPESHAVRLVSSYNVP